MNEMEKMWAALEAHQHIADHKGYGKEWARMCSERTADAADAAADAAAAAAADAAASAVRRSLAAIDYIAKANKGEQA